MAALQSFIDETMMLMTGLGEMKVAEAIFLTAVDAASQTLATSENKNLVRKVMSLAYQGQNIIKTCSHLPRDSKAEKYAHELWLVAHKIDSLVSQRSE